MDELEYIGIRVILFRYLLESQCEDYCRPRVCL